MAHSRPHTHTHHPGTPRPDEMPYTSNANNNNNGELRSSLNLSGSGYIGRPTPDSRLCHHRRACAINALRGFVRAFTMGYSVRCSLSLFSAIFARRLYRRPQELVRASFLHRDTLTFALFLGLYSSSYKAVLCFLRFMRQKEDGWNATVAGACSGLSILLFRSNEIATYAFTRALEVIFYALHKRGIVPTYKHGDSLLFAISTGFLAYCLFLEPYAIKPAYARFLTKATGNIDIPHQRKVYGYLNMPYW